MKHLWEFEHDYYCSETNFYASQHTNHYKNWKDFLKDWGNSDLNLDLLFRWDWETYDRDNVFQLNQNLDLVEIKDPPKENWLKLFFVGQRQGIFKCCVIRIRPMDEKAVINFLQFRFEHLKKLWEPFGE